MVLMSELKLICSKNLFLVLFLLTLTTSTTLPQGSVTSQNGMVVTAEPIATRVGVQILKSGGNAIDAGVAAGFALAVTYPTAGNIGGGGYMVLHLKNGENIAIDFREKAPLSAHKNMYLNKKGDFDSSMSQENATSSGVPGSVAGLIYALKKYGTMSLKDVITPAIQLAENGFILSHASVQSIESEGNALRKFESTRKIFYKNEIPYKAGDLFIQKDLAKTLSSIRDNGIDGFYKGEVASLIVKQMKNNGGFITEDDLLKYQVVEKKALQGTYRGYDIVTMPPSSSGGIALIEMLNILENYDLSKEDWGSAGYYQKLVETMKRAYADRSEYLGDPAFVKVPQEWLTSKEYAKKLFSKINKKSVIASKYIKPGKIKKIAHESEQTTHYSIMDRFGNAVSVTTTLNSTFGSKLVVDGAGFLLNNEMDDFSAKPGVPNQFGLIGGAANAIAPEKRMLSSMTPTIILKNGVPVIVVGSPGGSTIITAVLQVVINCIDFRMNIREAIDRPRIHHQWYPDIVDYEPYSLPKEVIFKLKNKGYVLGKKRKLGLVEAISYDNKTNIFFGATDSRGSGLAEGE